MKYFPWKAKNKSKALSNAWDDAIDLSDVSKIAHIVINVDWLSHSYHNVKAPKAMHQAILTFAQKTDIHGIDNYHVHNAPQQKWRILPPSEDGRIFKRYTCGFDGTELDARLRDKNKDVLIVSGVDLKDAHIKTAINGSLNGYQVVLLSDLCSKGRKFYGQSIKRQHQKDLEDASVFITTSSQLAQKLNMG